MKDVSKDNEYSKENLWPTLQGLNAHQDVGRFWSIFNLSKMQAGVCDLEIFLRKMAVHQSCTPIAGSRLQSSRGEEICELVVHFGHCPLTFKLLGD